MKKRVLKRFLVIVITICIVIPQTISINILATNTKVIDDVVYEMPRFLDARVSDTVSDFVYNNDSLIYSILTYPSGNTNGTVEVRARNSNITYADIPNMVQSSNNNKYNVTTIANRAFYECDNLKTVTIADGVVIIGDSAFAYCNNLRSISLPRSVAYIGRDAFYNCDYLDSITILSSEVTIYNDAFYGVPTNTNFYVVNESVRDELIDCGIDSERITIIYNDNSNDYWSYRVTVNADTGGTASGDGNYRSGDTVYIKATPKSGYEFDSWNVTYGDVSIKDYKNEKTSFRMRSRPVTITARFNYIDDNKNNSSNGNNNISGGNTNELLNKKLDDFFKENVKTQSLETGNDIVMELGTKSNVSTEEFKQILGKNINIVFILNGYKWTINGMNVRTDITNKAYCELGVSFPNQNDSKISNSVENKDILQFELLYNGDLPFEGTLEFSIDKAFLQPVYMYSYDIKLNTAKYKDYYISNDNGIVKLDIKESSKYVLTSQVIKDTYVVQNTTISTIDSVNIVPYFNEDGKEKIVTLSTRNADNTIFIAPKTAVYNYKDNSKNFNDITNHWALSSINFVSSRELFTSIIDGQFKPDDIMTKGMFLMALGKLYDINNTMFNNTNDYITWASQSGILNNIENVASDSPVTREEMAVILMNYSNFANIVLPQINRITNFADNNQISSGANFAVSSMQAAGIINGKDGNNFDPKGSATRAEASAVIKRFIENILYKTIV